MDEQQTTDDRRDWRGEYEALSKALIGNTGSSAIHRAKQLQSLARSVAHDTGNPYREEARLALGMEPTDWGRIG